MELAGDRPKGTTMNVTTVKPVASPETIEGQWLRELRRTVALRDLRETCTR